MAPPQHQLPNGPMRALRWFCDPELIEDVEGDLTELFNARAERDTDWARRSLIWDVIMLFRPDIIRPLKFKIHRPMMLKNYILTALRSAKRYKGHTALNLLSLIIGVASCLIMLLWINDELNVDQFHEKNDRLYQVWRNMHQSNGDVNTTSAVPQPMAVSLRNKYP